MPADRRIFGRSSSMGTWGMAGPAGLLTLGWRGALAALGWRRIAVSALIAGLALVAVVGAVQPLQVSGNAPKATAALIADATPATATAATAASAAPTATATAAPTQAIVPPSGSILDTGLGGLDLIDVATKCTIVLVLLFITLRVLGRMQSAGGPKRGGRLEVLESRPLAPKASLHLVAVGDRRLVVGLTPGGMVSLAELKADELESPSFASELAAQEAAVRPNNGSIQTGSPLSPGSPLSAVVAPIDAFAGRLASILGGGRAR